MYFMFEIDDGRSSELYLIKAPTMDAAIQKMHTKLRAGDGSHRWSANWEDLKDDVIEGNQTCYGPITNIIE